MRQTTSPATSNKPAVSSALPPQVVRHELAGSRFRGDADGPFATKAAHDHPHAGNGLAAYSQQVTRSERAPPTLFILTSSTPALAAAPPRQRPTRPSTPFIMLTTASPRVHTMLCTTIAPRAVTWGIRMCDRQTGGVAASWVEGMVLVTARGAIVVPSMV